jgi:hypothetical protein
MTTGFAHALDRLPIVVAQRLRLIDDSFVSLCNSGLELTRPNTISRLLAQRQLLNTNPHAETASNRTAGCLSLSRFPG